MPLVSVVIPSYNRPESAANAVQNVMQQTYSPIEIIVVDDHSPEPIIEEISLATEDNGKSVRIIRHNENRGANAARNTGVEEADGKFIAFLDDDDRWHESKISKQVEVMENDPNIGLVYTGRVRADMDGKIFSSDIPKISEDPTKELLLMNRIGSFSLVLVRKSALDEVGKLDEELPCWQDTDLFIRISQNYGIDCIEELLTVRFIGAEGQITRDFSRKEEGLKRFIEKHSDLAGTYSSRFRKRMISRRYFNVGWCAVRDDIHRRGIPYFLRSIRADPTFPRAYAGLVAAIGGPPAESLLKLVNDFRSNKPNPKPERVAIQDGKVNIE